MNTRPSPEQEAWHEREIGMFIHFGLYTYREKSSWTLPGDPGVVNPVAFDPRQWVDVATALGAEYIVFTAKHADGFCLWQSETTDYGVKSSPWKDGKGDIVEDLSAACAEAGLKFGIYLSPADAHFGASVGGRCSDPSQQESYDRTYRVQLTELLTRYGDMCEVWFDGSCVTEVADILSDCAPDAMVFQGTNSTIRWVGNEAGYAPYPAWNAVSSEAARSGISTAAQGNPDGDVWLPLEVDTTIRDHHWMWEEGTEDSLKSLDELMNIYYRSVGHGAVLLLNSNPDRSGVIPERDARRAAEFGAEIRRRFFSAAPECDGGGWVTNLKLGAPRQIDHVISMEDISGGERVREYVIEGLLEGNWSELTRGASIGHKKIDFFPSAKVSEIRVRVEKASNEPVIKKVSAFECGVIPDFDRNRIVVHDPFLVYEWPAGTADRWTSEIIDLQEFCNDARQYICEFVPNGDARITIGSIALFHEGTQIDGYVSPSEDPNRWILTISAVDSDYSMRFTFEQSDEAGSGGKVFIR